MAKRTLRFNQLFPNLILRNINNFEFIYDIFRLRLSETHGKAVQEALYAPAGEETSFPTSRAAGRREPLPRAQCRMNFQ